MCTKILGLCGAENQTQRTCACCQLSYISFMSLTNCLFGFSWEIRCHCLDQPGLELTSIHLPQLLSVEIKGVYHHSRSCHLFFNVQLFFILNVNNNNNNKLRKEYSTIKQTWLSTVIFQVYLFWSLCLIFQPHTVKLKQRTSLDFPHQTNLIWASGIAT